MKYYLLFFLLSCTLVVFGQTNLVISGGTLKVNGSSQIVIRNGSWTNNGNFEAGSGTVILTGNINETNSSIGGNSVTTFCNLEINKTGGTNAKLDNAAQVLQTLSLSNGHLNIQNYDLTILPGGIIAGYGANRYILTSGLGSLVQEAGSNALIFPIGRSLYNPLSITNSGTTDNYSVRVTDMLLENGTSGAAITENAVQQSWIVDEEIPGGSNLSLTANWWASQELQGFNRNYAYLSQFITGGYDISTSSSATGSGPFSISRQSITDVSSPFAVLEDRMPPNAVCNNVTVQLDASGMGSIDVDDVDGGSTDDAGIATRILSHIEFFCTDVNNPVSTTLMITDVNGNSSSCMATVTVEDDIAPTALCQNVTVQLDEFGTGSNSAMGVDNGSGDACGIHSISLSQTTFDCSEVGSNAETLTVTDVNGNVSTCSTTITVEDNVAPTAACQNVTVQLDEFGTGSTSVIAVNNGSNDACGIQSISLSQTVFGCSEVGTNTETLTVTDVNGNVSTCSAAITVEDNVAPVARCQNITVQLDQNGEGNTSAESVDNGSNDACGIASLALSQTEFDCSHVGNNPVTLTVTDVNDNVNTCSAAITVEDNVAPIALCQNVTLQLDQNGAGNTSTDAVDNGTTDACGIASLALSQTEFDCSQVGNNPVTLTVTDVNSNVNTCFAIITVEDNVAPVALCQNVTVQLDANGNGSSTAEAVNDGSSDACGIASLALSQTVFECNQVGDNQVTLTVTDVNSNVSTCSATITVEDNIAPIALCQNVTVQLDQYGEGSTSSAAVDNGSNDACGIASLALSQTAFDCSHVGDNPVTLTVTDVNGNVNTCIATIIVQDNIAPVALCQNTTIQLNNTGQTILPVAWIDNGSNDACGLAALTVTPNTFDCNNVGFNTVTVTVTDNNGNSSTCSATATVQDNIAPTISQCEGLFAVFNGEVEISSSSVINFSATDACGILSTTYAPALITCDQLGQNVDVLVTVTDVNGNSNECLATVKTDGLPCGWMDFGDDGIGCEDSSEVEYDVPSESFTISSNGCVSTNFAQDDAAYTQMELCGDGEIIAHVTSINPLGQGWAGITLRESEAPGAKKVELLSNLGNMLRRAIRTTTNGYAYPAQFFRPQATWLKLVRSGNFFIGYASIDGINWQNVLYTSMSMNECIQAGLIVTNFSGNTVVSATFDNVSVNEAGTLGLQLPNLEQEPSTALSTLDVNLFPNPAKEVLYVEIMHTQAENAEVEILNQLGQRVLRQTIEAADSNNAALNLHQLESGTYFLRVRTDQAELVKKFLIVK